MTTATGAETTSLGPLQQIDAGLLNVLVERGGGGT